MANRKDSKGRVLKPGESERSDGVYQYRYTDVFGKRHSIYSKNLTELRKKEGERLKYALRNVDISSGDIKVKQLLSMYLDTKKNLREASFRDYVYACNAINKSPLSEKKIKDVKTIDVKQWVADMYDSGLKSNTIRGRFKIMHGAFKLAEDDELIIRNPCNFRLSDVIKDNAKTRNVLSEDQQELFLKFVKKSPQLNKYYNEIYILLNTGLRAGELLGLTDKDIDFENNTISINHQICYMYDGRFKITETKTDSGNRTIPITKDVASCLADQIQIRTEDESKITLDGLEGFLFFSARHSLKNSASLSDNIKTCIAEYNKVNDEELPYLTAHSLRHTYCSTLANRGMSPKSLQYLMGHADIETTFGTYAHTNIDNVTTEYYRLVG